MADIKAIAHVANSLQKEIIRLGLGKPYHPRPEDLVELFDIFVKSQALKDVTRKLFVDGHYARAVEEAYKCVNNTVKDKSQLTKDGQDLMNQAFSEKNPVLKLNNLKTVSQKDEQVGYMHIFGGCMTGIRNPRAHEHKKTDSPETALEMIVWANHLMSIVKKTKRVKKSIKVPAP
jgi:uncharacterized protein (TIGR02391 family)